MTEGELSKTAEQGRWEADYKLRARELELKESENKQWESEFQLRTQEFELKTRESKRWLTPVSVAIFAAAIAAIGSAGVSYLNGTYQREEDDRKSEALLILESIKTNGDVQKAVKNLELLVKAGLVSQHKAQLSHYLETVKPEDRPALGGNSFALDIADALCGGVQTNKLRSIGELNEAQKAYDDCLKQLSGIPMKDMRAK